MKKRLFLLLALVFLLSLFPVSAEEGGVSKLIVNNVDVFSCADPGDVLGDGSVSFDRDTATLTLRNANLTKGVSDPAESWAESPIILFSGSLTLHLTGSNTLACGTSRVMGQALRNNAIVGDELIITAEPGASLSTNGMIQADRYAQRSGTMTVALENDHGSITKWAMYITGQFDMQGGTLALSTNGAKKNGALMLDGDVSLTIARGAELWEGSKGADTAAAALTFSSGLTRNSKNHIRIVLPDLPESVTGEGPNPSIPLTGTAYASATQLVEINGSRVSLPTYALLNEKGDPTNYVRLRDLAALLDGTAANYDVLWDKEAGISILSHHAYDSPNGTEGNVPFSGDRPYTAYLGDTLLDGTPQALTAFQLTDDEGGAHTYYQLRKLGEAMDFNVGWTPERGMFIEPDKPYTDED